MEISAAKYYCSTLHVQKTRWNLFIDESGPTYLAAKLIAKKSAFVSLGLF